LTAYSTATAAAYINGQHFSWIDRDNGIVNCACRALAPITTGVKSAACLTAATTTAAACSATNQRQRCRRRTGRHLH
jgi:hypothetical protein